ncbi:hypothetical protein GLYMA_14G199500v4 [Glycine max]|uniref:Exocyst subunit Exo70 family protein n=2 Tax=Glycine max TaxID=3847 RepID=K7M849_SOYBN|nr:hypothetical protein GYH30_040615 [Glycine max]KRH17118.1 hypothetical protein GLYMA_14G199500v4 [Glycine max]
MMPQLMTCIRALQQGNSNVTNMLSKLVKEYLEDNSKPVVIDRNFVIDALPSGKINDLRKNIKLVMGVGFAKECYEVYCNWRRESLKECLINLLGLPEINVEEKSRLLEFENYILRRRIEAIQVALGTLIPSERRLCDSVFQGFSYVADLCFTDICRGTSIQLLNIAVVFARASPSYWRWFEIIGMFEAWRDEIPEFQSLFPESVVKKAMAIHDELGEASRDIFMKVINMIFHNPEAKIMVRAMDGKIKIDRIMKRLERKLVAESKHLGERRYFFMMNSWRLVELCAEKSGLDVDCFKKYTAKIQQNLKLYQRSSWNVVLDLLKLENDDRFVEPNANAESMKDKLKLFNNHFKDLCSIQSRWAAFDMQLREQIIMSLENILLPAYGNFIGRFQNILGKHSYEYIKYGMFDIQDQINHLFLETKPMSQRLLKFVSQVCSSKNTYV